MAILTPAICVPQAVPRLLSTPVTLRPERDAAADIIKGTACLLMVAAHVRFAYAPWLQYATMAAVLFFATTGMNVAAIVERRPGQEKRLARNALFLFFAGFADNYVQDTMGMCDVFQSAGLAMLAMLLLRWLLPHCWTWLFPVPFLIHVANQHFHWKVADGGISSFFLAPGLFPLLPWLSFYLFGAHLKRQDRQGPAWLLGAAALAALVVVRLFRPFTFDKWWMSPEYFLIGCAVAAWSFAALRRWMNLSAADSLIEIRRWGANSLVFYLLNNFVICVLQMLMPHGIALLILSIAITAVLLRPALAFQRWTARQLPYAVLLAGFAATGIVLTLNSLVWPNSFYLCTFASFGLTLSFFACQPAWKNLSRTPKVGQKMPVRSAGIPERPAYLQPLNSRT